MSAKIMLILVILAVAAFLIFMAASKGKAENSGKKVTLSGTARDAKGSAVLMTDNDDVVYIDGLDSWPADVLGKRVRVTGVLREKKYLPSPVVDETGAISQGAEGNQSVLEKATWKVQP